MPACEPILTARLDALEENLNHVKQPSIIQKAFKLELNVVFNKKFWDEFELRLAEQSHQKLGGIEGIRTLLKKLDEAQTQGDPVKEGETLRQAWKVYLETRDQLKLEELNREEVERNPLERAAILCKAWADYLVLREQCQEIFLEFHDVIAGLVYREKRFEEGKGFDATIFYAADALISDCATKTLLSPSFSVPSPREALAWTIGRIVRMRYSEWTIWSLPLVAHEFGQLLLSDSDYSEFTGIFDRDLKPRLMELNTELRDALKPDADESTKRKFRGLARKRVENELRYYLADAFGTWVIGPAYAYAAIHQRLNPTYPSTIETTDSFDHERAIVILGCSARWARPASREAASTGRNSKIGSMVWSRLGSRW